MILLHLSHAAARLFLAFTLFFLALSGCNRRPAGDEDESGPSEPAVVPVKIAPVSRGDAQVTVAVTGKTDALKKEKVLSPVAGWIVSLKALEGNAVRKGAVLATIRPKEAQSAIAGAQALLERARTPAQEEEARKALALAESGQNTVSLRQVTTGWSAHAP